MNRKYKLLRIKELRNSGHSYREILKKIRVSKRDITKISKKTNFSRKGKIRYFTRVTGLEKPIKKQKLKLTLAKTRIIGNLLFDGSVCKSKEYHYVIMYVNSSIKLVERFSKDLKEVYGVNPSIFTINDKSTYYRCKYNSRQIYEDLLKYIPSYSTSSKLSKIPEEIMKSSKKRKLEFLRTFWDNEGCVTYKGIMVGSSNSYKIIKQLIKLHKEFGLEPGKITHRKKQGSWNTNYILRLKGPVESLKKFLKYKIFTESIVTRGHFIGWRKTDVVKYLLAQRLNSN